jgi:hypothetical protein
MRTSYMTMTEQKDAELRELWISKLGRMEVDLVRQKAALRDRFRWLMNSGCGVEAGQVQMQLRELDKELQKVADRVNDIHKGTMLPYSED